MVVDRLWRLLVQPAGVNGWLGVLAGHTGGQRRSWFDRRCDAGQQGELQAIFDTAALRDAGQPSRCSVPANGTGCTLEYIRQPAVDEGGDVFLAVARPDTAACDEAALANACALWATAMAADAAADRQASLLAEQKAIVDHIADGLLVVDRDLIVKHMNAAAGRILSLDPRTSIGKPFGSLLDFQPIIEPILASGEGYVDRELIIDSDRRHLHLVDTAVPVKDRSGRVVSIVNSFREIQRVRSMANRIAGNYARYSFEHVIGSSAAITAAITSARKAARGVANVLLTGPSGVGKEVFAQAIHNASSRSQGPFIAINCAALPRDLIESELFGYVGGSFTGASREGRPGKFEAASGGTIFLDEISELPLDVQAKLLRVLQEREVVRVGHTRGLPIDVRLVSASNRDLVDMCRNRTFREDLYYRCHVIGIRLPALAERREDIPVLASHFLRKSAQLAGRAVQSLSDDAIARLMGHDWPGNVRELENVIEQLVHLVDGPVIAAADIVGIGTALRPAPVAALVAVEAAPDEVRPLKVIESEAVASALEACLYNVTEAARRLGISKPALYARIRAYGIPLQRRRPPVSQPAADA